MWALKDGWVGKNASPYRLCRSEYIQPVMSWSVVNSSGNSVSDAAGGVMRFWFRVWNIISFGGMCFIPPLDYFLSSMFAKENNTDDISD